MFPFPYPRILMDSCEPLGLDTPRFVCVVYIMGDPRPNSSPGGDAGWSAHRVAESVDECVVDEG